MLILSTAGLPQNSALIAVGFSRSALGVCFMNTAEVLTVCKRRVLSVFYLNNLRGLVSVFIVSSG